MTARLWAVSLQKVAEKSESCYTSSVPSLGNVYGSANWKSLGLSAQFCCSPAEKTFSELCFIHPEQEATSMDSPACSNLRATGEICGSEEGISLFSRWQRKRDV